MERRRLSHTLVKLLPTLAELVTMDGCLTLNNVLVMVTTIPCISACLSTCIGNLVGGSYLVDTRMVGEVMSYSFTFPMFNIFFINIMKLEHKVQSNLSLLLQV